MEAFETYKPNLFPRTQRVIQAVRRIAMLGAVTEPALAHREPTALSTARSEASDY